MDKKSDKIMRIGVIGAGSMTVKRHLPALIRLQEEGVCEVVEICDINIDAANISAKKFGIECATHDADALVKRADIDAVCLFGPAEVHYKYGLMAMSKGKHIFVEKPPARTLKQMLEMSALAKSRGLVAVAGLNRRFQKNILHIQNSIAAEAIQTAEAFFHKANSGVDAPFGMKSWLGVTAIHALDVLCFIMGDRPTEIQTVRNGSGEKMAENFSSIIKWGDRHAVFSTNNSAGTRKERYAFHGKGVSYVTDGSRLQIQRATGEEEVLDNIADASGGIYEEFSAFFKAVVSGGSQVHSLDKVAPAMYLMELIEDGYNGKIDWSVIDKNTTNNVEVIENKIEVKKAVSVDTPSILVLNSGVLKDELSTLSEKFTVVYGDDFPTLTQNKKGKIVAIITGGPGAASATRQMFEELKSVSVLGVVGASVKKWGGEVAIQHGVSVINTADVYAGAVAEFILMQALLGLRRASVSHDVMRQGSWEYSVENKTTQFKSKARSLVVSMLPKAVKEHLQFMKKVSPAPMRPKNNKTQTLRGKKVGLLGYGEITKKVIPLFKAFDCEVLVNSDYLSKEEAERLGVKSVPLHEALAADVISMNRGLSKRTEKVFGTQEINTMKSGSVFINSGRAGLVDTEALMVRLKKGDLFACLDVFDDEPLSSDSELRKIKNVFLTSHIAGSIKHVEGLSEVSSKLLIEKIVKHLAGDASVAINGLSQFNNMT